VERISVVEIKKGKEWGEEGGEKLIVEFRCFFFFFVGLPTCTLSLKEASPFQPSLLLSLVFV
jgi:hypothetical protein